ncbi:hypothetical protein BCR34DRAFT_519521, partial [Clohesyomyces aquaticus]
THTQYTHLQSIRTVPQAYSYEPGSRLAALNILWLPTYVYLSLFLIVVVSL